MKSGRLIVFFGVGYLAATLWALLANDLFTSTISRTALVALSVAIYITIIFFISQIVKRLDIVDIAWGGGFIVAAISSFLLGSQEIGWNIQTLVSLLVIIWGMRLGYYILRRVVSHPEDARYVALRNEWKGSIAFNAYFRIFFTQGLLATIISIAVIHINLSMPTAFSWITYVGLIVWMVGFFFESIGDAQLKAHLADSHNKAVLMTSGLWRYTRHPNYFGEATQWWGVFIIALGTMFGWVGIITPVLITYLLLAVSGVPLTEARFEGRSGWAAYKKRTNKFIPFFPKA